MPQQNQPKPGKQNPPAGEQQGGQQQRNPQQSDQQRHKQGGGRTERQGEMDRPGTEEQNLEREDEEDVERGRD